MQVGLIGAGVMGSAIAARLLDCGAALAVFDAFPKKCSQLAERGARLATSAADAAGGADFVVMSLNTATNAEQAVFGPQGVAEGIGAGAILIDMSSIDAGRTADFARLLKERCGAAWIDAPLSGGAPAVAKGLLTLMIGGDAAEFERARPLLALLSQNYTRFGEPGAGQTVKMSTLR